MMKREKSIYTHTLKRKKKKLTMLWAFLDFLESLFFLKIFTTSIIYYSFLIINKNLLFKFIKYLINNID
jgi:hypothetical protein